MSIEFLRRGKEEVISVTGNLQPLPPLTQTFQNLFLSLPLSKPHAYSHPDTQLPPRYPLSPFHLRSNRVNRIPNQTYHQVHTTK